MGRRIIVFDNHREHGRYNTITYSVLIAIHNPFLRGVDSNYTLELAQTLTSLSVRLTLDNTRRCTKISCDGILTTRSEAGGEDVSVGPSVQLFCVPQKCDTAGQRKCSVAGVLLPLLLARKGIRVPTHPPQKWLCSWLTTPRRAHTVWFLAREFKTPTDGGRQQHSS